MGNSFLSQPLEPLDDRYNTTGDLISKVAGISASDDVSTEVLD